MAFQSVPDTVESVVQFNINSELVTLTFYTLFTSGYALVDVSNLAAEMDNWASFWVVPLISTGATYLGVNSRGLEDINDVQVFDNTNTGAGTRASQPTPNNVCKSIKRASLLTGRSARGRVYFPLTLNMIDGTDENRVSAGAVADIVDALNAVAASMALVGGVEVIVSRFTEGVERTVGTTFPVFTYASVSDVLNTQRRRLPSA